MPGAKLLSGQSCTDAESKTASKLVTLTPGLHCLLLHRQHLCTCVPLCCKDATPHAPPPSHRLAPSLLPAFPPERLPGDTQQTGQQLILSRSPGLACHCCHSSRPSCCLSLLLLLLLLALQYRLGGVCQAAAAAGCWLHHPVQSLHQLPHCATVAQNTRHNMSYSYVEHTSTVMSVIHTLNT